MTEPTVIASEIPDVRAIPLADLAVTAPGESRDALERVLPGEEAAPVVTVAAFSSSI